MTQHTQGSAAKFAEEVRRNSRSVAQGSCPKKKQGFTFSSNKWVQNLNIKSVLPWQIFWPCTQLASFLTPSSVVRPSLLLWGKRYSMSCTHLYCTCIASPITCILRTIQFLWDGGGACQKKWLFEEGDGAAQRNQRKGGRSSKILRYKRGKIAGVTYFYGGHFPPKNRFERHFVTTTGKMEGGRGWHN